MKREKNADLFPYLTVGKGPHQKNLLRGVGSRYAS